MPITLGTGGQPGFDEPLELMKDCHRRIERFIEVLIRVVDEAGGNELPDEHRRALATALDYFSTAAPRHTRDEEESLFPRMREADDPDVFAALARIASLEADHVVADRGHERVDGIGRRWLADGTIPAGDVEVMREMLLELRQTYQRHIQVEDEQIFPLANRVLSHGQIEQIGQEMKARRR